MLDIIALRAQKLARNARWVYLFYLSTFPSPSRAPLRFPHEVQKPQINDISLKDLLEGEAQNFFRGPQVLTLFDINFHHKVSKEWKNLSSIVKQDFTKKLQERAKNPIVPKDKLSGMKNCYKIKSGGFRLVYQIFEKNGELKVIAVGERSNSDVYRIAKSRLSIMLPFVFSVYHDLIYDDLLSCNNDGKY